MNKLPTCSNVAVHTENEIMKNAPYYGTSNKFHDSIKASALDKGASLLADGVRGVTGQFERGAAVAIRDTSGRTLAKGVTAYSAEDIRRIAGRRTEEAEALLGYKGRPAIIHRDDMVRL